MAFKLIGWQQLAKLVDKNAPIHIFDASAPGLRARNGIIPGAILLSSFDRYDCARELPADRSAKLVFYCGRSH